MNSNQASTSLPQQADWDLDIQEIFSIIFSRFWFIFLCFLVGMSLGLTYITFAKKVFSATATIQVEQNERKIIQIEDITSEDLKELEILKTIEQNFLRKSLLIRVVKRLDLKSRSEFASVINAKGQGDADEKIAGVLAKSLDVRLRRSTRLIDISVQQGNPKLAADLANAVVDEFMQETLELRYGTSQNAFQFLIEEAERLKSKLSSSELALQEYQYIIQLKDRILEQEKVIDVLGQRYLEKHPKMIQARSLLKELQTNFLNETKKMTVTAIEPYSIPSNSLPETTEQAFNQELRRAESRLNVISRDVQTDRALYETILQRLKETSITKGLMTVNVRIVERAFVPEKPSKPKKMISLAMGCFAGVAFGLVLVFIFYALDSSLKTVDVAEKYLDLPVLGTIPDVKEEDILKMNPATSYGLRWRFQRLIQTMVGGTSSSYGSYGRSAMSFRGAFKDFTYSLRENFKASFNLSREKRQDFDMDAQHPILLLQNPSSKASEAIRTLRANLSLLGKQSDIYSFLFTSAVPFEGKSFTAANFAVALAQQNHKTLLIDADLRRPTMHHYFGESVNNGLTDYLLGNKTLDQVTKATKQENLYVMTAGTHCPRPSELLGAKTFSELLELAKKKFDRVVIDSAPITAVADTMLLASKVQYACLVVQLTKTPRKLVKRACIQLENAQAHLVGTVLNRVPEQTEFEHNAYYYHYQSGEGYGQKEHSSTKTS